VISSIPSPEISYIDLGPLRLNFYALFILAGIILAVILSDYRLHKRGAEKGVVLDIALWAVPFGILGGRLFHVFTHPRDYFYEGADLLAIFYVWEGGLAIYGALLLGAVGVFIGVRQAGLKFWSVADAVAPGILLAQAIGRWGNYFNQELFGLPTDLPWALEIPASNPAYPEGFPAGVTFHPTFAYEMLWSLTGVVVLLALDRRLNLRFGRLFGLYLVIYSLGRAWIEAIRIDPSEIILGLRINIWSAIVGIVIGLTIIIVQHYRHRGVEASIFRTQKVAEDETEESVEAK
jgi:prolipoprotein diacylglyceryl transferase